MAVNNIFSLIDLRQWDGITGLLENDPELAHTIENDQTVLHALLRNGATPLALIDRVATLAPESIDRPEGQYGDTCLHICCRNAQFSHAKLRVLLRCVATPDAVQQTNRFGGTALHSAANHNANVETLQLLIQTCPSILDVRTPERHHALDVLCNGFLGTIHGHTHICKILKQTNDDSIPQSSIFDRFWNKVRLIALATYYQSDRSDATASPPPKIGEYNPAQHDQYLVHGMLLCGRIPDKVLHLALRLTPEAAKARDGYGNTPLHYYIKRDGTSRPHCDHIRRLLRPAAVIRNHQGELPMHFAIRDRLPFREYWGLIPKLVVDPETKLPPALMAASIGGREATNTCFCLLRHQPEQVKR